MLLKVHYTLGNFLRTPLVPILRSNIAAGAAGDIHLVLVTVVATRTLPNEFSVVLYNLNFSIITTDLTVVTLSVQLCIHDVVVDELHDGNDRITDEQIEELKANAENKSEAKRS